MPVSNSLNSERRHVLYSGNVQGVGFRYSTQSIARNFQVVGFVRNLPGGSVELTAEGQPAELDRFLDAISDRLSGHIRKAIVTAGEATNEFASFEIRF